jgi:hypothetical protein
MKIEVPVGRSPMTLVVVDLGPRDTAVGLGAGELVDASLRIHLSLVHFIKVRSTSP